MRKVCFPVLITVLLSLLFSCASGTNPTDDSVGYITMGSSRAGLSSFGIDASALSNLKLSGSLEGGGA